MKDLILLDRVYFKIPTVNIKISKFWLKGKINKIDLRLRAEFFFLEKGADRKGVPQSVHR